MVASNTEQLGSDRVSGLSEKQKDCLRLVAQNMNSKQIARQLNVSEHTVDQRIRQALRILEVSDRFQAAQRLVAVEEKRLYQPLIYQSEPLAEPQENAVYEQAADHRGQSWLAYWIPPLGGSRHDLDASKVLPAIIRVALVVGGGCAALVATGLWLMRLFS